MVNDTTCCRDWRAWLSSRSHRPGPVRITVTLATWLPERTGTSPHLDPPHPGTGASHTDQRNGPVSEHYCAPPQPDFCAPRAT